MASRELIGDLAVLLEELGQAPRPRYEGNTAQRFTRWYAFGERLFHLAIEVGIAVEGEDHELAVGLDLAGALVEALEDGLSAYIGHEYGHFYGGQPWRELCVFRSAVEFLRDLLPASDLLDTAEIERLMEKYGVDMFEDVEPPPGMPRHHWWWYGDTPPQSAM